MNDVVKEVPLDRILLETDAPYMTPRESKSSGKNKAICHSGHIPLIARKIAEIKDVSVAEVYAAAR